MPNYVSEAQKAQNMIPVVQGLYDKFQMIGITLPLEDATFILYNNLRDGDHLRFSTYCEDKLLQLPAYENALALGLGKPKTLQMVTLPDYQFIRSWIINDPVAQWDNGGGLQMPNLPQYLVIIDGVVRLRAD